MLADKLNCFSNELFNFQSIAESILGAGHQDFVIRGGGR
ncbi:hypothetical protein B194_2119 [Serratia plymuthica A30]|nr:hypothetical protein B194_2119 [Serratia plymuthica A30]